MCLTCGCGKAHDDHNNSAYLTYDKLKASADVDGISVNEALKNLNATVVKDRQKHEDEYTGD